MQKESKIQLAEMQSLMERMDKHYTKDQSTILTETRIAEKLNKKLNEERSNATVIDGVSYSLSNPEELIKVLSKEDFSPKKSWYVTLGYVKKYDKIDNKSIKSSVDSFSDDAVTSARGLNNDRINNIIDNHEVNKKGQIKNPYMSDSYTNYIVEVDIIRLMYGRNLEYFNQKQQVKTDLDAYREANPEKVQQYLSSKGLMDFTGQSYDDARAVSKTKIPNVNGFQKDNGNYELDFNTPKTVFKKLKSKYFIITDEDNIEEISQEEAEAYARLFATEPVKKVNNDEPVVQEVDKAIRDIKSKYHGGDVWTNYNLESVFLLNFTEGDNSQNKLQYYNPDAIVEFVKGRELKSGIVPSRTTTKGIFKPHFEKMK